MSARPDYIWQRDVCNLTGHVSVQCWSSQNRENTYQTRLRYQRNPGEPRKIVYRRYLTAKSYDGAKRQSIGACRAWLARHDARSAGVEFYVYNEILSAFGLPEQIRC